ncbi:hypothetical protein GCM10009809_18720 [Isoptericola hypogeus]|uniref:ParB-like N-terminal domain-containing protein n=1 Tax=Isoptericola hypogeus TaxID=300179 RepID=A0ABN2JDA0_9MICO
MSQKKRGLGRGLGALIPSGPENERPVDVFFPTSDKSGSGTSATGTAVAERPDDGSEEPDGADGPGKSKARSASWDSAISGGRLRIRTGGNGARPEFGEADPVQNEILDRDSQEVSAHGAHPDGEPAGHGPLRSAAGLGDPDPGSSLGVITRITVSQAEGADPATAVPEGDLSVENGEPARDDDEASVENGAAVGTGDAATTPQDDVSRETDLLPVPGAYFAEVPVAAIRPNTWQPRTVFDEGDLDELVDSISEIGVLQPIVVRPDKEVADQYELIMGERRWRASQAAGLETIPAIVRSTEDSDMLRDALLENLHRAALNPLEEAAAYRQLLDDFGCTHEELASRIARSRPQISNTLRLLKLPPLVQRRVAAGVLSAGHARALLGLSDGAEIERLAQRIVSEGLSVRATEEIVTLLTSGDAEKAARRTPRAGQRSEAMDELATRLSDRFETRVKVNLGKTKGRLTVEFASVDDLNRILEVMAPQDPGLLRS